MYQNNKQMGKFWSNPLKMVDYVKCSFLGVLELKQETLFVLVQNAEIMKKIN
jgi:hypothetical protein